MADSIASLGIAVDSAGATKNLNDFAGAAKQAGSASTNLEESIAKMNQKYGILTPGMRNASNEANNHATRMERLATSTQKAGAASVLFTRTIQGMVVALAGGGLYKALESAINGVAALGDRMQDTRLSGETLQGLRIGAAEARVSTEELNKALDTFTKVSKQAAPEAKEFYKALNNISPSIAEAFKSQAGKAGGQDERLRLIADALKNARTETERYQLAQKALGTDNDRVIDMFVRGRQALADYIETARNYGIMVDDAFIKKAQDAQRQLGVLSSVIADKLRVAIVDILPDLMKFIPVLERLGAGIMDLVANALPTEERPLGTLNRELEDTRNILQGLYKDRDAATAANKEGGLMVSMGLSDNGLADIKTRIDKYEAYYNRLNKAISGNDRAQFGPDLPKPANSNLPGFAGRASLKDDPATPFDRAVNSINRHIAAMKADAEAVGSSVGEHARLRTEAQLLEAAQQKGGAVTDAQREKIKALGQAAADAAMALAKARIASDVSFDHKTAFLSSEDVSIAQQLRQLYGDDVPAALASTEAAAMRMNNAMREVSQAIENNLTSGLTDIVSGTKSVKDGFSDMANSIIKEIERMVIKMMVVQPIMRSLQGLMGGFGFASGGVFGSTGGLSTTNHTGLYAKGGVFANDNVRAFANGGAFTNSIVSSPTLFRFAQGTGLMGEAGPEAIMPLKRGPDGSLGVRAAGGGTAPVINIINQSSGKVEQGGTRQNADGSIDVFIRDAVRGVMLDDAAKNGDISKAMSARMSGFNGR